MPDIEDPSQSTERDRLFAGSLPIQEALRQLRLRLLDLSSRNRLLSFKHSVGKSLQFVHSSPEAVYRRLVESSARVNVAPVPEPDRSSWVTRNGRLGKPDVRDYAKTVGIDSSHDLEPLATGAPVAAANGSQIRALYYGEDLAKHCRKLDREARLAIEETGANMLFLVLGFLEFPEADESDKLFLAPLISIPVALSKMDGHAASMTFSVAHTGEELAENLSLVEKLNRDYAFSLPDFDEETDSVENYFAEIEAAIHNKSRWRVRRLMTLALLSFSNMLLVRDLDPDNWPQDEHGLSVLLTHPIVKQVFEGKAYSGGSTEYGEEYPIDEHVHCHLPLIYDADSSQHSALIDVVEGKNLVIEGPPGTGKSQTITNLIAVALHEGKKVLFVAEKLAALEVVKARLKQAGLEHFVLELHSNKTNKKRVLEDLERRVRMRAPAPSDLPTMLERLDTKRQTLKAYVGLLNGVHGNQQDMTVHKVLWRAELYRQRCGEDAQTVEELTYVSAPSTTGAEYAGIKDLLKTVAEQYQDIGYFDARHPFWGFFPEAIAPGDDMKVQRVLQRYADVFESFARAMHEAEQMLEVAKLSMSAETAQSLISTLAVLAPADPDEVAFEMLPRLFTAEDPNGEHGESVLADVRRLVIEAQQLLTVMRRQLLRNEPAPPTAAASAVEQVAVLKSLGFSRATGEGIHRIRNNIASALEGASGALADLGLVSTRLGLAFDSSVADTRKLSILLGIAESAPDHLFHLRHEALQDPQALIVLSQAQEKLKTLQKERATIDAHLHLDIVPEESQLKAAILVLREGDAWYRVFQKRWRRAVATHRQLEKVKERKTAAQRLVELEVLVRHQRRTKEWNENTEIRRLAGSAFKGEESPLVELVTLARWIHEAADGLEQGQLGTSTLDPLTVDKGRLRELRAATQAARRALANLQHLEATLAHEVVGATERIRNQLTAETWSLRIGRSQDLLDRLLRAEQLLTAYCPATVSADEGLAAINASARLPEFLEVLRKHSAGQALLGPRLAGLDTNLEPADAALTYGRLIRRSKLPVTVQRVLLSEECGSNYAELMRLISTVGAGWDGFASFGEELKEFGKFDPSKWTEGDGTDTDLVDCLVGRTRAAGAQMHRLLPWVQYLQARADTETKDVGSLVRLMEAGNLQPENLANAFGYRFYASIAHSLFRTLPSMSRFSGIRHSNVRLEYAELDREVIRLRGRQVAYQARTQAHPPAGQAGTRVDERTDMVLLNLLMPQTRPRMPIRKILKNAGRAVQELKPCFMMGPQAVAQFLAPGSMEFDIIVMDEASQLKPEEAIGAIARGKQLVVVGDPKQLPPTTFFSRMTQSGSDDDDGGGQIAVVDSQSILDVCIGHFQPVRTLRWHYRSQHESLIAFSNHHFYRGTLVVFPSPFPKGKALGLRYHYVHDGVYENQMNQVEALRVVDAVVDHILQRPDDSLGVVTLNIRQRDLIAELIEDRLRSLPEAAAFEQRWEDQGMGLFIKNLENVQGDERDCVIISTTFGKARGTNVVRQTFGPITREGGWRRLNVLFTRARKSVSVYSSMRPEDIVEDSSTPVGTKALKNYLEYARSGILPRIEETGAEPDSDFEIAVMDVLRTRGFEVTPQLGVAGFRIDIGVKHPDYQSAYLAAIECDGASYHSGVSVRDRDRIRQEILEQLGWRGKIWRIWSTDWFRSPVTETDRLLGFLAELRGRPVSPEYVVEEAVTVEVEPGYGEQELDVSEPVETVPLTAAEDEDLEIEVGDLVTYALVNGVGQPDQTVRITSRTTDVGQGLLAEHTPLAQSLLAATVGETVVLRVPGREPQKLTIIRIRRQHDEAAAH